jgi:hypothetical protein
MGKFAFACAYSNVDLSQDVIEANTPLSPTTSILSGTATGEVIAQFNKGETLNVLLYNGSIMQGHTIPAGGCEYQDVNVAPISGSSSVMYQGPAFVDSTARTIFHELIHELFKLTEQADVLHADLIAGEGYLANSARDLLACFNGNNLNTPQAIAALKAEKQTL